MSSTRAELLTQPLLEALKTLQKRVEILKPKEESEESTASSNSSSEAKDQAQQLPKLSKTSEESTSSAGSGAKNKWKDALIMFSHTINLLINMCENALNTSSSLKTDEHQAGESSKTDKKEDESQDPPGTSESQTQEGKK